jgi:urease accessory protein
MMPATANLPITRTLRDPSGDAELSRARGSLRIGFAADARGGSRLTDLSQYSPSRVLRPLEAGDEASAVLINTAGGVCGGDRYRVAVDVGNHARATVTTQAAEKVYRALDSRAQLDTTLRVGAGARLHWAPQETILFDGARFARRTEIHLDPNARLLAAEMVVFGRRAKGEVVRSLDFRDDWRLFRDGALCWADALEVAGDPPEALTSPAGIGGAEALATALWVGGDPEEQRSLARARLAAHEIFAGVSMLGMASIARILGGASAVRRALTDLLSALRPPVLDFGSALPRVWSL